MPYLSIVRGIPTMIDDGIPAPIAPASPAPIEYARPDDRIVLRPGRPPMVVKAAEELELEVREIEPDDYSSAGTRSESESEDEETQYGTWKPDTSCFIPENKQEQEPSRPNDLDLWRVGLRNEDADVVIQFHRERLEKCDDEVKTTQTEVGMLFNDWADEKDRKLDGGINYNKMLFAFLEPRYCKTKNKKVYWGICLKLTDEERERKEELERAKREKEEMTARDLEERLTAQEQFAHPPDTSSDDDAKQKKLKDTIRWNGKIIHRHPEYPRYGGDLITGEIYKLKGNKVERLMNCSLEKGVTLECPKDEEGKRVQKYKAAQIFIAEAGRLKQATKFHTKLKINTESQEYKTRPFVRFYPIACLSYEYDGGLDFNGDIHHIKTGNALVNRCKKSKEINDYIGGVKDAFEDKLKKYKDENARLKSRVSHLETQVAKLNTPLSAGAIQLQDLLMTKVGETDTTFKEMLQFCFKDITRNYPKDEDDDQYADFGIFEMSPRGLPRPDENHIRQID